MAERKTQATYRRILPSFWTDPEVRRLRLDTDQLVVLLHCFTSPHSNMAGLFWCPLAYVAAETGVDISDVQGAIEGPLARFVSYDHETEEMLVHKMAFHNIGPGGLRPKDNRVKGLERCLADAHSPELLAKWAEIYPDWPVSVPEPQEPAETHEPEGPSQGAYEGAREAIAVTDTEAEAYTEQEEEEATTTSEDSDGLALLDERYPDATTVLRSMKHRGGAEATAATLRTRFVYLDEAHAMPDPSVQGLVLDIRLRYVASGLLEMADQGKDEWSRPLLAGFIRRMRRQPDPTSEAATYAGRNESDELESERARTLRENARARSAAEERRITEEGAKAQAAAQEAREWYDEQPPDVQDQIDRAAESALYRLGFRGYPEDAPDILRATALTKAIREARDTKGAA